MFDRVLNTPLKPELKISAVKYTLIFMCENTEYLLSSKIKTTEPCQMTSISFPCYLSTNSVELSTQAFIDLFYYLELIDHLEYVFQS